MEKATLEDAQKIFISNSQEDTQSFAKKLAGNLMSRSRLDIGGGALVLALIGELGSGKTTFARVFAEVLGVKEKVKSPTFIIMRKSQIPSSKSQAKSKIQKNKTKYKYFYHFDVYRIHSEKEILNLGWEEIISNPENVVLVEWADKIEKILPKNSVKINFKHLKGDKRGIVLNVT